VTVLECWLLTMTMSELLSSCLFPVDCVFLEHKIERTNLPLLPSFTGISQCVIYKLSDTHLTLVN